MTKTLLLADDSVTIQKVVGISFANEDIQLVSVDNGDDAIAQARQIRPDVVLADVVMPGKNGYEVCAALRADPQLAHVPVLLLTGTFEAFDEARARACGATGHIAKPFEAQALVERVKQLLSVSSAPAPARAAAPEPPRTAPATPAAIPLAEIPEAGEGFDFFDEELAEPATPAAPAAAGAFAFGSTGTSEATVAILPEDEGFDLDSDIGTVLPRSGAAVEATVVSPIAESTGGSFDFDLGSGENTEPEERIVRGHDLAEATVFDAGVDVSLASEDTLGESFNTPPAAISNDYLDDPLFGTPEPAGAPAAASAPLDSLEELLGVDEDAALEPVAAAVLDETGDFGVSTDPELRFAVSIDEGEAPLGEPVVAGPELQARVHDTLEKIAWEALGGVSEQIVQLALERIEKIAWEVIPELAERLVREEIQRMKGESD